MTEYITKINQLDQELDNEIIHRQVNEIRQIDNYVKSKSPCLKHQICWGYCQINLKIF